MRVFFHSAFYDVYTSDPAATSGRMESIVSVIGKHVTFVEPEPAAYEDIAAVHTEDHIERVRQEGLYDIAALAAGGAVQAAVQGLSAPGFGLIRPPGHHASADPAWGFCYFNNMAVAMEYLKRRKKIKTAYVLDIDLHYGDGTVNILGDRTYITLYNPASDHRERYMDEVGREMKNCRADMIGISAGFDNHENDWGSVLTTDDYREIGRMVRTAAQRCGGGCFGILEGGYNHDILGRNVLAMIEGLAGK